MKGITPTAEPPIRSATLILAVLTAMNLLNYVDRYILASVLEPVQTSLGIESKDGDAGLLGSIFLVSYCVFSPLVGWFGDRVSRKYLIAGGVAVWSLATLMCGSARSYEEMLFWPRRSASAKRPTPYLLRASSATCSARTGATSP